MRRSLLVWLSVLFSGMALAQPYGNEWIDHDKQYWYFNLDREGIFRIDSATLSAAGFPLATLDARDIQVFGRERQVPIYIQGEEDGVLNAADFIEFYAPKNDAWKDSTVWDSPEHINNPHYSLYNDTIRYFITWDPDGEKKRVLPYTNTDFTSQAPRPWTWAEALTFDPLWFHHGVGTPSGASTSSIGDGEGYFTYLAEATNGELPYTFQHFTLQPYTGSGAPDAFIRGTFASSNTASLYACNDHHVRLSVGPGQIPLMDTVFSGVRTIRFEGSFPAAQLGFTTPLRMTIVHDLVPCASGMSADYPDWVNYGYSTIRYPHALHMGEQTRIRLHVPPAAGETFATMNFNGLEGGTPLVYALGDTMRRILPVPEGYWKYNVPLDDDGVSVYLIGQNAITPITSLQRVNGSGFFTDLLAAPVEDAMLIITHPTLLEAANTYASFRQNNPHNAYNTLVANVDELYMQYGGGIARHPLAIRNFIRQVVQEWPSTPKALFLIGKSVQAHRTSTLDPGKGYRYDATAAAACLVPSYGFQPSDAMFTLGLSGQPWDLTVPVGRLSARTPQEVTDYMDKVAVLEGQASAAWMKNILHFRGGSIAQEVAQFNAALESYRYIAEDTLFMGHVTKFVKNGNQDIPQSAADSVTTLIENGVSLMTFFAHAYGSSFDITISDPAAYDWNGRYPVMLGNSCYTGNIHLYDANSMSEQFVRPGGMGSIAFLASVHLGLPNYLQPFTANFYRSFADVNYGKGIGEHVKYASRLQLLNAWDDIGSLNNVQTFTVHGDPTVVMNSPPLPDLDVQDADISVIPATVTADLDSFDVQVVIRNIGRGTHASFSVALQRSLSGVTQPLQTLVISHSMQSYQDTVVFTLPVRMPNGQGVGLNNLELRLDLDPDLIEEGDEGQDEINNRAHHLLQVVSGDLIPVFPYDLAVLPDAGPRLRASTGDPFAPVRNYRFQIDTTDAFNSPVLEQTLMAAPGGVVEWQPTSIYGLNTATDSVVFYWRSSLDSAGTGLLNWRQQSFQHLTDRRGWGQSHFLQFKPNGFSSIEYELPQRRFGFFSGPRHISVRILGNSYYDSQWSIDLEPQEVQGCGIDPALHIGVVDPFDFQSWRTRYGGVGLYFGNVNDNGSCYRQRQERYFIFRQAFPAQMDSLADMLQNDVPDGHYVVVYTWLRLLRPQVEASSMWPVFQAIGATNLVDGTVPDLVPYILIYRKGDPASVVEAWGQTATEFIEANLEVQVNARSGSISAPRTNAMLDWNELSWRTVPAAPYDSVRVELSGITANNSAVEVPLQSFHSYSGNIPDLDPIAPAAQYPFLHLKGAFWNDSVVGPQPAQLDRWHLLGVPAPECAIDPPSGYFTYLDSIFQGEQARAMVAIRNIGEQDMDSLLVAAWVVDQNNVRHLVHHRRNPPLPVGGILRDTIAFGSTAFPGANALVIEANPVDTATGTYDQLEQYHGNNVATIRFRTVQDRMNPLLDVTFDGIHILDGDIVSARPEIQVTLDDENEILLLDSQADTALFKVYLTDPSGNASQVHFRQNGVDVLRFIPADGPDNVARIIYNPVYDRDGRYRLVVRASDRSNNASGDRDYAVNFEVINKPTITEVLNYPNPFTTSTRFVFTLTGHEVPMAMRIQIMTITGRVVREVSMSELGNIRIGRNITDFAWDGTDQFGDRLARGVYLYRVIAQLHGAEIEYRQTTAGEYFHKGFGKMYLLR
ncbi:MAG TPA: C25 family cysteine peptidase [Flavobacteriales bacterium]